MGRQYKGLDHTKVTVKLDERQFDIVRQYGWKLTEQEHERQALEGKYKPYNWKMSDVMRDAVDLLGRYIEMSDNMETGAANLLDIAEVFDKIEGKNAPVYAQQIREAAAMLMMFCYKAEWGYDGDKIVFSAKSPTKSKHGKKMARETEITIRSADGLPLIRDSLESPSEAAEATGEDLPQFVARATESRAALDKRKRG